MDLFKNLLPYATYQKEYHKNQVIFEENEKCEALALIIKGEVIIASYTFYGNEIIFNKLNSKQIFGQSLIYSSSPIYKGKVISKTNTVIAFIPLNILNDLLKNGEILQLYLKTLSDKVLISKEKERVLSFSETQDRLLYYLSIHPQVYIQSITDFAKILCVSRESLSRTLYKLKRQKKIFFENKTIQLI